MFGCSLASFPMLRRYCSSAVANSETEPGEPSEEEERRIWDFARMHQMVEDVIQTGRFVPMEEMAEGEGAAHIRPVLERL